MHGERDAPADVSEDAGDRDLKAEPPGPLLLLADGDRPRGRVDPDAA